MSDPGLHLQHTSPEDTGAGAALLLTFTQPRVETRQIIFRPSFDVSQVSLQLTEHDLELLTLSTQGLQVCVSPPLASEVWTIKSRALCALGKHPAPQSQGQVPHPLSWKGATYLRACFKSF